MTCPVHAALYLIIATAFCSAVVGATSLAVSASSSALNERISHSYYFESHGRDDIREWRATILKGAQFIKIDINFQTNETICRAQTQVPPSHNFSNGCFVLVHTFAAWTTDYNSTYDIVDWLLDDRNLDVLTLRPIIFQMCLKNHPGNLCKDALAPKWIALMDQFHAAVQPIISDPRRINSNVQFVFDQLDSGDTCVDRRWAPWNSTWIGEAGTGEDNNNGTNATFQMVNMDLSWKSNWAHLNATGFGKFYNGSYAIVAWEPVDEIWCNGFFAGFREYKYAHEAGTILAYNSDPSMFHTYTASQTERYSHFPFAPENSLTPVVWYSDKYGALFTISLIPGSSQSIQLSIHLRGSRGTFKLLFSEAVLFPFSNSTVAILGGRLTSLTGQPGSSTSSTQSITLYIGGASSCLVRLGLIFSSFYNMSFDTMLEPVCAPVSQNPHAQIAASVNAVNSHAVHALFAVTDPKNGTIVGYFFSISSSGIITLDWNTLLVGQGASADDGLAAGFAFSSSSSRWSAVVSWSSQRQVYACVLEWASGSHIVDITPSPSSGTNVKVGIGRDPSIAFETSSSSTSSSSMKVLLAYGWSYCFNDLLIDDDGFNMIGTKICNLRDTWNFELTENPVNSYVFAGFEDFKREFVLYGDLQTTQHQNGFATTCSDTVFHGVFDLGFNATVALVPRGQHDVDIVSGGFLGIAVLTSNTWPTVSFCGNPVAHNGQLVLDSFPLFGFYNQSAL